jgi:AcrR family transcriptional regulator
MLSKAKGGKKMKAERSSARQRLLETARELFYREGIRTIGVDTIVERSGVGKATLYRHFPTKDDLITAYIEEEDHAHLQWFDAVTGSERPPKELLLAWLEDCEQRIQEPDFRGCPFLNAMAEIAETEHPAYQSAARHERTLRDRLAQLSRQAGARDPAQLADQLLLVVNGALASASLFGEASPAHQLTTIAAHLIDLQTSV